MKFLALILGSWVYMPYSILVKFILYCRGIHVGKRFYIEGIPKLRGDLKNITIGNDVKIMGDCDIRTRENGTIVIGDGCKIDTNVRLIAANDATLTIGRETNIACYSVFNCGANVTIGQKVMISGFVYVQSSNHGMQKDMFIKDQKHTYGEIILDDDVWLGSHVSVLPGVYIKKGAVVGSHGVVTRNVEEYEVVVGVPAKHLRYRN